MVAIKQLSNEKLDYRYNKLWGLQKFWHNGFKFKKHTLLLSWLYNLEDKHATIHLFNVLTYK